MVIGGVDDQRVDAPPIVDRFARWGDEIATCLAEVWNPGIEVTLDAQRLELVDVGGPFEVALDERNGAASRLAHKGTDDVAIPRPHAGEVVHGKGLSNGAVFVSGGLRFQPSSGASAQMPGAAALLEGPTFFGSDHPGHVRIIRRGGTLAGMVGSEWMEKPLIYAVADTGKDVGKRTALRTTGGLPCP